MPIIVPSLLDEDFSLIKKRVDLVKPYVNFAHYDVMDGEFVSNTTFRDSERIGELPIRLCAHLMIARPEFEVRKWSMLANVDRVTVHVEAVTNLSELVGQIRKTGKKIGLSLNPETRLQDYGHFIAHADYLLIMGVEPGASGQVMFPDTPEKLREAKKFFPNVPMGVDGGVNLETKNLLIAAGADELIVNSALFKNEDIGAAFQALQSKAYPSDAPSV